MNSGSSAPIGSGVQSAGTLAAISCHQTSRPASQATLPPVCLTTSTFLTPGHFFSASSALALSGTVLAAAQALVGGDDDVALAVLDAVGQAVGREAAEHHRMDRADARAGQHGVGRLGDHRQVDRDAIALLGAQLLQRVGHAADFGVQLAIGDLLATSPGSSPSQMIAVWSARLARWRSRQLAETFSTPSWNQRMRTSPV